MGFDVHAENIAVAIAEAGRDGEVRDDGKIPNTFHSVEKLLRKLRHPDKELRVGYEAGPCGFVLARFLKRGTKGRTLDPDRSAESCPRPEKKRLTSRLTSSPHGQNAATPDTRPPPQDRTGHKATAPRSKTGTQREFSKHRRSSGEKPFPTG